MADCINSVSGSAGSTDRLDALYQRLTKNEDPLNLNNTPRAAGLISKNLPATQSNTSSSNSLLEKMRLAAEDASLGAGQLISQAASSTLLQQITPRIIQLGAVAARGLGGLITLGTSGYRIWQAYRSETAANSSSYPQTRREVFLSAASITGGFAAGSAAGLLTAAAVVSGAPAALVTGLVAAGVLGTGYAAYKAREFAAGFYSKVMG